MFKLVFFVSVVACAFAAPAPGVLVGAPVVTATSSQVVARNYNAAYAVAPVAPVVAAAPIVRAAPLLAAPAVAAPALAAPAFSPYLAAPALAPYSAFPYIL